MTYDNQNYEHTQTETQHDLQLLPKQMCFFAVEDIDVLMFGFGCRGETAESAKNVVFLEIRPNILWVSASDLIRCCGRA